jgi:hypothetical protein
MKPSWPHDNVSQAHHLKQLCLSRKTGLQDFIKRIGVIRGWMTLFPESASGSGLFHLHALESTCRVDERPIQVRS